MNQPISIYAAGPIDDITREEAQTWRADLADIAPEGVVFFDPSTAWHCAVPENAAAIDHGNRNMIVAADGVLVNLGGPGRGFGTIREIEFARMHGKPVAVAFGEHPILSLLAHDLYLDETLEGALSKLVDAIRERQAQPVLPFGGHGMVMLRLERPTEDNDADVDEA